MKKLMIAAATAAIGAGAFAATSLDAQVYDVSLTVKSTACKEIKYTKTIATLEGEDYSDVKGEKIAVRKQGTTKIAGVIWGCDCETIADPAWRTYNNGTTVGGYLFWNVGADNVFNIFSTTFGWAAFNRIDTGDKAEGVWLLRNWDADNTVALLGAGFGKVSGTTCRTILSSMSGNFAGFLLAGSEAGGCKFCGESDCTAWQVCPCTAAYYDTDLTAAYGSWKIKYNKSASQKLRKTGRLSKSFKFSKKTADAETLVTRIEAAAAAGALSSDDDDELWPVEEEGEQFGEYADPADVAVAAYTTATVDGEEMEPEEYEGDNEVVNALLFLTSCGDAS